MMNKERPKIIAEVSCNHENKEDQMFSIIQSAKAYGADWVKVQTYTPDEMCIDNHYHIGSFNGTPWDGENLVNLYTKGQTPYWLVEKAFRHAKKVGIPIFSSVFSIQGLEFLEKLGCPMYKIASFENNHYDLIYKVSQTKKPIIVSTGFAKELDDISNIISAVEDKSKLTLMHCISAYPTYNNEANIHRIPIIRNISECEVGFSDHTLGHEAAVAATVLGATYIEKHLMARDINSTSIDKQFSLGPYEFAKYVDNIRAVHKTLFANHDPQGPYKEFRRGLYALEDIFAGKIIKNEQIGVFRPCQGLEPIHKATFIGKRSTQTISKGMPLLGSHIEGLY